MIGEGMQDNALRDAVREAYSAAAEAPGARHPFPVGRSFAAELGYSEAVLCSVAGCSAEAFTGVANVGEFAELAEGQTVLDLGCGAGLDSTIAAWRVGTSGTAIGVDFSAPMLARAAQARAQLRLANLAFVRAGAERLPLADRSIDTALVNGIFNLNPAREQIFRELARVLRPGGRLFGAELVLKEPLPESARSRDNWFA